MLWSGLLRYRAYDRVGTIGELLRFRTPSSSLLITHGSGRGTSGHLTAYGLRASDRVPGLPTFPILASVRDRSLLLRNETGLAAGVLAKGVDLEAAAPKSILNWMEDRSFGSFVTEIDDEHGGITFTETLMRDLVGPTCNTFLGTVTPRVAITRKKSVQALGQLGDGTYRLTESSGVEGVVGPILSQVAFEAKQGANLFSVYHTPRKIKNRIWLPMQSDFLDIRVVQHLDRPGHSKALLEKLEGSAGDVCESKPLSIRGSHEYLAILISDLTVLDGFMYTQIALQMLGIGARFGLFCAPPYYVIVELFIQNDRNFLLIGDCCDMTDAATAPRAESTFVAHLLALFLQADPAYQIEAPSEEMRKRLDVVQREVEVHGRGVPGPKLEHSKGRS